MPRLDWQICGTKVAPSSPIGTPITLLYLEPYRASESFSTHSSLQPLPNAHHRLMSCNLLAIPEGERSTEEKNSFPHRQGRAELSSNDNRVSETSTDIRLWRSNSGLRPKEQRSLQNSKDKIPRFV